MPKTSKFIPGMFYIGEVAPRYSERVEPCEIRVHSVARNGVVYFDIVRRSPEGEPYMFGYFGFHFARVSRGDDGEAVLLDKIDGITQRFYASKPVEKLETADERNRRISLECYTETHKKEGEK